MYIGQAGSTVNNTVQWNEALPFLHCSYLDSLVRPFVSLCSNQLAIGQQWRWVEGAIVSSVRQAGLILARLVWACPDTEEAACCYKLVEMVCRPSGRSIGGQGEILLSLQREMLTFSAGLCVFRLNPQIWVQWTPEFLPLMWVGWCSTSLAHQCFLQGDNCGGWGSETSWH